jgi:hypothetical protein
MSQLEFRPPQAPRANGADARLDPEALIEEARRRARRRRGAYAGAALVALVGALGAFLAFGGGGGTSGRRSGAGHPGRGLPHAARIVGTIPVAPQETVLFAARARMLFELVVPPAPARSVTVVRLSPEGTSAWKRIPFDRPYYLTDLSAGPDGLYAGTAVIKRFTNVPDELVRIDAKSLSPRARAFFPSRVAAVERGQRLWASIGDGRIVRLDPRTLTIRASRRLVSPIAATTGGLWLSKPALGLGSLWVLAGDARRLELVRMDPTSLAVRSSTRVPTRGKLAQGLTSVVADARHVYLVGHAIVAAAADGKLAGGPAVVPGLATAEIHGAGLVGLTGSKPALVLLDPAGRILARTRLLDAGGEVVVSGRDAWFLGDAGRGQGLIDARLR